MLKNAVFKLGMSCMFFPTSAKADPLPTTEMPKTLSDELGIPKPAMFGVAGVLLLFGMLVCFCLFQKQCKKALHKMCNVGKASIPTCC